MALERAGVRYRFGDIERSRLNLDPEVVRRTMDDGSLGAIAPVHVYGNPADPSIDEMAGRAGIPLLFDASHAAAAWSGGCALVGRGDASALSLHATKLLHAVEGGAVVVQERAVRDRVAALRGFGQDEQGRVVCVGGNAKMSEVHAAMGLAVLDHVDDIVAIRRALAIRYASRLPQAVQLEWWTDAHPAAYQPVVMPSETAVVRLQTALRERGVETRRYFSPSLDSLGGLSPLDPVGSLANSRNLAARVLCLPLHASLDEAAVDDISACVLECLEFDS
jgi:dTDP-4-amino-4,6-dideoxygalactose transaminase